MTYKNVLIYKLIHSSHENIKCKLLLHRKNRCLYILKADINKMKVHIFKEKLISELRWQY